MSARRTRILIAGGGIGGLGAALALLQHGIEVEIHEQAEEFREIGAGVQISPNGSCVLSGLGVFDRLQALSCTPTRKEIRHWQSGKAWPLFDLGALAVERYGYPYLTVFRPDLLQVLADAVRAISPETLRLKSRCLGVVEEGDRVTLLLADGKHATGDALIGADGVHSRIRSSVFEETGPAYTGLTAFRALIPIERVPEHMAHSVVGTNWVGPGGHVVHYPLQGGRVMNFVGTRELTWDATHWREDVPAGECAQHYRGWHPDVLALIAQAPRMAKWALLERPFLEHWSQGRITLLGDACHPTLPSFAQGVNMALEDGVVLARCLACAANVEQAFVRYEQLRMERTYRMVRAATNFMPNFNHPILADPVEAEEFIASIWQPDAVNDRYDWLFKYDAGTVAI